MTTTDKAILAAITLLTVAVVPRWTSSTWVPKEAVLAVIAAAGMPVLLTLCIRRGPGSAVAIRTAARLALAFVVIALVSALASRSPGISMVGLYQQGTGWVFVAGLAGAWALATRLGTEGRRWLEILIVLAAAANSVVAVLQLTVGLDRLGLPLYNEGLADGLQSNPFELGALALAAMALMAVRFRTRPRDWYLPLAMVGVGAGACGERLPLLIVVGILAWTVWRDLRERRRSERDLRATLVFCGISVAGVVAGSLLASFSTSTGSIQRAANSNAEETYGQRFEAWHEGLRAFLHHFLIGAGPGQFRSVTSALFPLSFVRPNPGQVFTDAHNFVVEYLTTTGILGLLALVGWLAVNFARARGPLVAAAIVLLVVELAEPLDVAVMPVALAALGAALAATTRCDPVPEAPGTLQPATEQTTGARAGPMALPVAVRLVTAVCVAVGAVAGALLIAGDGLMQKAQGQFNLAQDDAALSNAQTAEDFLRAWPEPATLISKVYFYKSFGGHVAERPNAIRWSQVASSRDPTNPDLLVNTAGYQLNAGEFAAAGRTAVEALGYLPWWPTALNDAGIAYLAQGDASEAHRWFGLSLEVSPDQPQIRSFWNGSCKLQKSDIGLSTLTKVCS
jgi:O-antigen ligase